MPELTSRDGQSVPRVQFKLHRMLEEATGAKLPSIEECSKKLLAGRTVCGVCLYCVQAWLNCVDSYVYDPIDDRMAEDNE